MNISQPFARPDVFTPLRRLFARLPLPLLEALLVLAWSSGFVGARFSIDHAPALLVVFWRCVTVALLLLPFVTRTLRHTPMRVVLRHMGIGLFAMAGYLAGVVQGIALGVPAGIAALIADLLPIGTALLTAGVMGHRLGRRVWLGLGVGLGGVLLVTHDALVWGSSSLWAYSLPLLGMLSLALATLWQDRSCGEHALGLLPNLFLQCATSAVVFAGLAGVQGSLLPVLSQGFAISVLWTSVLASLGGYGLYWVCLKRSTPTRVASVLYLSPAVTLLWAWALFGEPLSWLMLLGAAVSAVGVWLVMRG